MSGFKSPNHTQVPNDFFDMIPDMSEAELRVTLIMIRETRGWHRDAAKIGKQELADRSGLSFNGVTAGCDAAGKRGTFRRTNSGAKTRAEWELVEYEEPSTSEGQDPQPVRESPSASEGQVRVKERVKKIKSSGNKPGTPKANDFPANVLYREVTEKYPKKANWYDVLKYVNDIEKRLGRPPVKDDLLPYYAAWCSNGWNEWSINWLEYAAKGELPRYGKTVQKEPEPILVY